MAIELGPDHMIRACFVNDNCGITGEILRPPDGPSGIPAVGRVTALGYLWLSMVNISITHMGPGAGGVKPAEAETSGAGQAGAALLVIDVQARLAPAIAAAPAVIPRITRLIEKARDLRVPILASEQYSRGLGQTVPELRRLFAATEIVEKIHFAAPREAAFASAIAAAGIGHAVVAGMEAHVCVQQTALALLARGVGVTLAGDAVASRRDLDRRVALARLARAGAGLAETSALLVAWPAAGPPAAQTSPSPSAGSPAI